MATVKYVATKKFKYDGKMIHPGDEWTPVGGKWDEAIKDHFIQMVEYTAPKRSARSKSGDTSSK